jgi:hypothetical protein
MLETLSNSQPLIVVVLGLTLFLCKYYHSSSSHLPPGPPGQWFLGNAIPTQQYVLALAALYDGSAYSTAPTANLKNGLDNTDQSFLYDAADRS